MIFAHAPFGYLVGYSTKRWWQQSLLTRRQRAWIYAITALGGIFPDIDLFYFYLVDASANHRQFFTHSLLPYLIVMLIGFGLRRLHSSTSRWIGLICIMFSAGVFSHFIADSLVGRLVLLYPFSEQLIGLSSWPWYAHSVFLQHSLTTNYTAEAIIFLLAGYTFFWRKIWYICASVVILVAVVTGFLWLDRHTYKTDGLFAYTDSDGDGQLNVQDTDLDGDGIINSRDSDADNDGNSNLVELEYHQPMLLGAYFDFTNGGIIEIPLRAGLVNDHVLIERLYTNVGMPLAPELAADYEVNAQGYQFTPKDHRFIDTTHNWRTWFEHQGRWTTAADLNFDEIVPYDVIFFQSGHVALWTGELKDQEYGKYNNPQILNVSQQQPFASIVPLSTVIANEGEIVGVGRILAN